MRDVSEKEMEDREVLRASYPSNSKQREPEPEVKVVTKVVTSTVRIKKRSFGKKLAGIFLEDSTKSVGGYLINDVLIPAGKNLICDIVGWGGFAEMLLWGEKRGSRTRREGNRSVVDYRGFSGSSLDRDRNRDRDNRDRRDISRVGRTRHDFAEVMIATRGEAEEVLSQLQDFIIDYHEASVADFYGLVDIPSTPQDGNFGWFDLRGTDVKGDARHGYFIDFPRVQSLD